MASAAKADLRPCPGRRPRPRLRRRRLRRRDAPLRPHHRHRGPVRPLPAAARPHAERHPRARRRRGRRRLDGRHDGPTAPGAAVVGLQPSATDERHRQERGADYVRLAALLESGQVVPSLERAYPMAETADAMRASSRRAASAARWPSQSGRSDDHRRSGHEDLRQVQRGRWRLRHRLAGPRHRVPRPNGGGEVDEMLDLVGLTDVEADRRVRDYSLGMSQRLGMAQRCSATRGAHPRRAGQRARPGRDPVDARPAA